MSQSTDRLADTVNRLLSDFGSGKKSVVLKTGIGSGKMLTIVNTPQ